VRGGPVGHLQQLFNNHWNIAEPSDNLFDPPPIPGAPGPLKTGEFQCDVQIARTLDPMFTPGTGGEKGILETYLRAIHFATRLIYIENQYFNNDAITEALIEAAGRGVKVILLLNPAPDMPLYLGWQQDAVRRIADSLKRKSVNPDDRLGVFSTWTHASSASTGQSKPTLIDNYLHTKTALIDNIWATVGAANLDGASLDFLQYARPLLEGEVRNTEANVVVFEGPGTLISAVDALRRRLWSEHLGFATASAPELADAPNKDWLAFWRQRATAKKDGLMNNLDAVSPIRILEFPKSPFEESVALRQRHKNHATAKAYLQRLFSPDEQPSDVLASQFNVLGESGPPSFEFQYPETTASLAAGR
jgi:phosphatidylserine/phosphatidylglycerophosphate/cardiolipin synthase-like enzyme